MESSTMRKSNACTGLDDQDLEILRKAAQTLLDARGIVILITDIIGRILGSLGGSASEFILDKFGIDLKEKTNEISEKILWSMHSGVTIGMDGESKSEPWNWFHKMVAVASGAGAGFVGAPGLLWDLPITTGVIMRSVAEIARSYPGENLESDDTKRACIQVFAFGGPEDDDDDSDTGYWAVRSSLSHGAIELVIKQVASRFSVALSEKMIAQAVPIAGSMAGAGLNYAFIDYYQQMARVHYAIRSVERRVADPSTVRACFGAIAREIKNERKIYKK